MVGAMPPCQKRLLLHILASSTATSSSCSAAAGSLGTPQPARLHAVPAAGSRRSSAMGRRVLLRDTVPESCGWFGTGSPTGLGGWGAAKPV